MGENGPFNSLVGAHDIFFASYRLRTFSSVNHYVYLQSWHLRFNGFHSLLNEEKHDRCENLPFPKISLDNIVAMR